MRRITLALCLLALLTPASRATIITGQYAGTIDYAPPLTGPVGNPYPFRVGESVELRFALDTATLEQLLPTVFGGPILSGTLTSAGGFFLDLTLPDSSAGKLGMVTAFSDDGVATFRALRFDAPGRSAELTLTGPDAGRLHYDRDLGIDGESFFATVAQAPEPETWTAALTGIVLVALAVAKRARKTLKNLG